MLTLQKPRSTVKLDFVFHFDYLVLSAEARGQMLNSKVEKRLITDIWIVKPKRV